MLTDTHRPVTIESFVGLDKAKAILNTLLPQPGSKARCSKGGRDAVQIDE